ncbi:MAG: 16S rRNA (guanine(527)-N(7))-methyltransferase RsmG [Reichenbachiella sp.]
MIEIITKYFDDLTENQLKQLTQLGEVYKEWNDKINVVSRKDIDELYVRHVLHSLGIAAVVEFKDGSDILDIGTGGGFPGIPLAIFYPECHFTLVDSIAKKMKVVNGVIQSLELTNVTAIHGRGEEVKGEFDFIVSRAVTKMKPFYQWTKGKFKKESNHEFNNGIFYLKGGDLTEELKESKLRFKSFDLSDYFEEEFFETKKVIYVEKQ